MFNMCASRTSFACQDAGGCSGGKMQAVSLIAIVLLAFRGVTIYQHTQTFSACHLIPLDLLHVFAWQNGPNYLFPINH